MAIRPNEITGVERIMIGNNKIRFLDKAKNWVIISAIASTGIIGMNTDAIADVKTVSGKEVNENVSKNNFYMGRDLSKLPPGLQHCRDKMVALVYGDVTRKWNLSNTYTPTQRLGRMIAIRGENIGSNSKWIEPAAYLTAELLEGGGHFMFFDGDWEDHLKPKNPGLFYFAMGINDYFDKWVRKVRRNRPSNKDIEINFIRSIFTSAYISQEEGLAKADEFYGADLAKKTTMASEAFTELENMKGADVNSIDPSNAYNRRLNAAWSSMWLVNTYRMAGDSRKNDGDLINKKLEKPMRTLIIKLRSDYKTGPYYLGNFGKTRI